MRDIVAVIFGKYNLLHKPIPWGKREGGIRQGFQEEGMPNLSLKEWPGIGLGKDKKDHSVQLPTPG